MYQTSISEYTQDFLQKEHLWTLEHSDIQLFIGQLEFELGLEISRTTGLIYDKNHKEKYDMGDNIYSKKIFVRLNNDLIECNQIFWDKRQIIFRETKTMMLRRIRLYTIKSIAYKELMFSVEDYLANK